MPDRRRDIWSLCAILDMWDTGHLVFFIVVWARLGSVMLDRFESAQPLTRKRARLTRSMPPIPAGISIDFMAAPTSFARNEEVFGEGEPAEFVYKVEVGCIRTYNSFNDGRRHIGAFCLPGDYIALEGSRKYGCSADAVGLSMVRAINRNMLMARAAKNPTLLKYLLIVTALELQRAQNHNRLLLKSAEERVVSFLLEIARRDRRPSRIDIPMVRQDIGDHLGLTVETLSRVFSRLEGASIISLRSRHCIEIHDLVALNRLGS